MWEYSHLDFYLMLQNRSDIFKDKYKRLEWDGLSRTITAHMAHDAYWYIHPEQNRTLTVREAARLQSFPDWFRFSGTFTSNYRQIGEAVPPLLAKALGKELLNSILHPGREILRARTKKVSMVLKEWLMEIPESEMASPWRRTGNLWNVLLGMMLFENLRPAIRTRFWPTFSRRWSSPDAFLQDKMNGVGLKALAAGQKKNFLTSLARRLAQKNDLNTDKLIYEEIPPSQIQIALALCGLSPRRPSNTPSHRVAERLFGESARGSAMISEMLVARVIGRDEDGLSYAALLEVGERFCKTSIPHCKLCPINSFCLTHNPAKSTLPLFEY